MVRAGLLGLAAAFAACSEAGGEVIGGNLTDAGVAATTPPEPTEGPCIGDGTHWRDLYRDIFGPTGRPGSCSFRSNCHGTAEAQGAQSSNMHCFSEHECWESFSKWADSTDPDQASLVTSLLRLRGPDGNVIGFMPKTPSNYLFSPACITRVKLWIKAGAQED